MDNFFVILKKEYFIINFSFEKNWSNFILNLIIAIIGYNVQGA